MAGEIIMKNQLDTDSVYFAAVLVLKCLSVTADGTPCIHANEYRSGKPEVAVEYARADGWTFRGGVARCRECGNRGLSFGKLEGTKR